MGFLPEALWSIVVHFLLPSLKIDPSHLEDIGSKAANQALHKALLGAFSQRMPDVTGRMTHDKWFPLPSERKDDPGDNPAHSLLGSAIYFLWEFTIQVPQSDKIADLFKHGQFPGVHKVVDAAKYGKGQEHAFLTDVAKAIAGLTFPA